MTDFLWTDEAVSQLTKLWIDERLSASQCAEVMGFGLTRNSIIGKVHRLKLQRDKPVYRPLPAKPHSRVKPLPRPIKIARPPEMQPDPFAFTAATWAPLPGSTPATLEHLKGCKWPVSDPFAPRGSVDLFCNCEPVAGKPYCSEHTARSKGTGTSYERAAVKLAIDANKAEWAKSEEANRKRWHVPSREAA